jgi:hypothetical protein
MSIERDLLCEAKDVLADYWDPSVTSMISKNRKLYYKIKEHLDQPDQEPVTEEELKMSTQGMSDFAEDMFKCGFRSAERYYLELRNGDIK